jgi:hypothetical protein
MKYVPVRPFRNDLRLRSFANSRRSKKDNVGGHELLTDEQFFLITVQFEFRFDIHERITYDTDNDQQARG